MGARSNRIGLHPPKSGATRSGAVGALSSRKRRATPALQCRFAIASLASIRGRCALACKYRTKQTATSRPQTPIDTNHPVSWFGKSLDIKARMGTQDIPKRIPQLYRICADRTGSFNRMFVFLPSTSICTNVTARLGVARYMQAHPRIKKG